MSGWWAALPAESYPRDESAEEARRELEKQIYQDNRPSPISEAMEWLVERFARFLVNAADATPGGGFGLVVFAVLVAAVIALIIWKFGLPGGGARVPRVDPITPTHSAADHTQRADAFAAEGRWDEAIRERLRAIVAGLVSRDLVDNRPGRTATEVAAEGGRVLPGARADLASAVEIFGEVWYGRRTATAEHDQRMRTLAKNIAAARPGGAAEGTADAWVAPGTETVSADAGGKP